MEYVILLKANLKKHRKNFFGIFLLTLLAGTAIGTVMSIWSNSDAHIREEMRRAGFGELTAWVSGVPDMAALTGEIERLPEIDRVEMQSIIFSSYTANGQESDSEGQLIPLVPEENRYRFFTDDLSGYRKDEPEIGSGEIYVSPSMISMFDIRIGDEITFPIARAGKDAVFTVKGFYEDPFMGSSMIGMKGFLICEADRAILNNTLRDAGIDALARDGAMLHIFSAAGRLTISEQNRILNENTALAEYAEFVHGKDAIAGFMLILQKAFCGLLLAFAAVLLFVILIVLGHSISSTIEADYVNLGILKTMGLPSARLRLLQLLQSLLGVMAGLPPALLLSVPLSGLSGKAMLTTTGILIPAGPPPLRSLFCFAAILLLLTGFILLRTKRIGRIRPIQAIRKETDKRQRHCGRAIPAVGGGIYFRLAFRQMLSEKRRYIGTLFVAVLLAFFASLAGRMDAWLGKDGRGMMDAFNPADHDIGVQVFGSLTAEETELMIRSFTDITDSYLLAMPGVAVNGVDHTANVISEPERFHILEGRTCRKDNEIVLTEFVASDFGVTIGDTVTVRGDGGSGEYVVSGIYSCANDMGNNVGMSREGYLKIGSAPAQLWCQHYFLADSSRRTAITEALEAAYGGDVHVHWNTWPGLSGIILVMRTLMFLLYGFVTVFVLIVTVMTGSSLLAAEQRDLGIYRALGFPAYRLRLTFALRFGMVSAIGAAAGTILAAVFGDPVISGMMKLAGIGNFTSAPSAGSILFPAGAVILLFSCFAYLASGSIKKAGSGILAAE